MRVLKTTSYNDIFNLASNGAKTAIVIPTNGVIKKNGFAVMGAGLAKSADVKFGLAKVLGEYIENSGNHTFNLGLYTIDHKNVFTIYSFPTKHHFKQKSDIALIEQSAKELLKLVDYHGDREIYLPKVGCGLGGLNWDKQVKPVIEKILDDRFIALI